MNKKTDKRPDPKPRLHPRLWQAYLFVEEAEETCKRHKLRKSSIEKGKSNLDITLEIQGVTDYERITKTHKKMLIQEGEQLGPIWDWLTSIKGLGEGKMAAQLLAQVDDIGKFSNVSKLWRFCGQAVIDGKAEKNHSGEKSHYNRHLKSICWLIGESFVKQQTQPYADIYYTEKSRQRELHPEKIKIGGIWIYTDGHLHNMAKRKMVKIFLQHFWLAWREFEGLPTNEPYVQAILGHSDIIVADTN